LPYHMPHPLIQHLNELRDIRGIQDWYSSAGQHHAAAAQAAHAGQHAGNGSANAHWGEGEGDVVFLQHCHTLDIF